MGNTDANMSGVEPERPPLPYGVLYPPPMPGSRWVTRDGQRYEIALDWSKHAKFVGARDDLWGEGFESRAFNHNDPSLKGRNHREPHPDDWDVQYRLGSPNEGMVWSDIITKWGLQILDKAGFINLDLGLPDSLLGPQGRYFPKRPEAWKDETIHPVFRRDMWKQGLSDAEWSSLKPAVLLASAFLDDPTTMCLFHALVTPSCHVHIMDPILGDCTKLQVPDSLTEAEQASIFRKICAMRQWTYFYWENGKELEMFGAFAYTVPTDVPAASL
jgi:hypothetical protein